jgi:regulator of sigma E protease
MHALLVIIALGVLVALHHVGHFLLARLFGLKVHRLVFGLGPTLLTSRRGATEYGLRAIPLGGSVKIQGMSPYE